MPTGNVTESKFRTRSTPSDVAPRDHGRRLNFAARPNIIRDRAALHYSSTDAGRIQLSIHDVQGRCVRRLLNEDQSAGSRSVTWDGRTDLGHRAQAGVYYARLTSSESTATTRLMIVE